MKIEIHEIQLQRGDRLIISSSTGDKVLVTLTDDGAICGTRMLPELSEQSDLEYMKYKRRRAQCKAANKRWMARKRAQAAAKKQNR